MQEDDIQLLKSALADVVRRLNITEEQQAVLNRKGPTKGGHSAASTAGWAWYRIHSRVGVVQDPQQGGHGTGSTAG